MAEKVIISGMGSISALGSSRDEVWGNYLSMQPRISTCCFSDCDTYVGKLFDKEKQQLDKLRKENPHYRRLDKSVLLSILAARQAVNNAGWANINDACINIGSSRGATQLFEKYHKNFMDNKQKRISPMVSPTTTLGNLSSWLAYDLGVKGASFSHSITCSTALHAILNAIAWIQSGMSEKFIAGGAEAPLSDFTIAQMKGLRIYSEEVGDFPCQPLLKNKNKSSLVLGEGAGIFCLEKDQNQNRLARIEGVGYSTELIEHNVSLSAEADCIYNSMRQALEKGGVQAVDSIVMHAPGTFKGDNSEFKAIQKLFKEECPNLISTKHLSGHTFGASGALSIELAILMLHHNKQINFPYQSIQINKERPIKTVMVNATGFGGNAVSIILSK